MRSVHMYSSSTIFLFLIFFSNSILCTFVSSQCLQDQKQLLLELRNNLTYDSSLSTKLLHWNDSTDCCQWRGVKCDSKGRASSLDLSNESISNGVNDSTSTLFRLTFLQSLNLARNTFNSVQFPSGFGKLTHLSYLNLSNSGFSGQIQLDLSNLTRLVVLDLSSRPSQLNLENPDLGKLIHSFTRLRELYLDGVNISAKGYDWCNAISSSLPNLRVLSLSNSRLTGPLDSSLVKLQSLETIRLDRNSFSSPFPQFFTEFPNLKVLTMTTCGLSGVAPGKLFQIASLETIDLSNNKLLEGSFLEFPSNGSLQSIVLRSTGFSGNVLESIGRLGMLSKLDLSGSNFSGPIPRSVENLTRLSYFDLSMNRFNGSVPSFALLKNLTVINLLLNELTGQIPDCLWEGLESLNSLDLSENSLQGEIPISLFVLPSLKVLRLSNNRLSGSIAESTSSLLSPLQELDLKTNDLRGPIPRFFFDLHNLSSLVLASNKFNGSVGLLSDFQKLTNLVTLDLSYNNLSIHVSENISISSLFPNLETLMLASCKMQKLPLLNNESSLKMLDLSDNQLHGEIPNGIWNGLISYLNLSHNQFTHIEEPYDFTSLDYLDLHSNTLSGQIPLPPPLAVVVDYSNNNFSFSLHPHIGNSLTFAFFFSIASNKVNGEIPLSLCNASQLQVLDLSNNSLHGIIPSCLLQPTLTVLNLRKNNLTDNIPNTFPSDCGLETLDFSFNHLQGGVPESLQRCTELRVLNLGNNELSGNIPCLLNSLTEFQVLVLRSNKFSGNISCLDNMYSSSRLQIIDVGSNNLSGVLPANLFPSLKGMADENGELDHLYSDLIGSATYYQDTVTVTFKGQVYDLQKILTIFTSLDFSDNHFQGIIPETIGELKSLYVLNFSHNALSGRIPLSLGNIRSLESLDLSFNNLGSSIPDELASLTSLSRLNLSYNDLVGRIPGGPQMQTFQPISFLGNDGLCGFPLNISCDDADTPGYRERNSGGDEKSLRAEICVGAALGFVVGVMFIFGPVLLCKRWRRYYNENIVNRFVYFVLPEQQGRRLITKKKKKGHQLKIEEW